MFAQLPKAVSAAAIAAAAFAITAGSAEAKDWLRSMDRHYSAAEATKFTPKGDNPQWDFDLDTVVNDMAWRARTASMLRTLPRPGASLRNDAPDQVADREEPPRLRFRF
ncbi:hypothetical protein AAFN88_21540 [Pelagibius sp. CAU 1746]|uniref:hypothetical protein n=1 Tax=Pelagibius sp. CAU 1746 TaxID=3140370 RepID=UPI00325BCC90